jgi:hypothetical protein
MRPRASFLSPQVLIEWMCTQERWNTEVAIICGAAARYRRATACSSHDDAHPDKSTLHTGAIRPHTGFVRSLFFISPRAGHGSSKVFEMLPAFSCVSCACDFRAGDGASILFCGPAEAEGVTCVSAPVGWLFWNLMANPLLGEGDSTSPPRWL